MAGDRLAELAARDVAEVARLLDLEVGPRGLSLRPCPACGAEVRGKGSKGQPDKRPPVTVYDGGRRWRCHAAGCDAGGDAVSLAAWRLTGRPQPGRGDRDAWRDLLAALEGAGLVAPTDGRAVAPGQLPPPRRVPAPPTKPPFRLPRSEVLELWNLARPVELEERARRWLCARGLEALTVAGLDLARALPADAPCPRWAGLSVAVEGELRQRVSWADGGWGLLLPCYDAAGDLVALRARWTGASWNGEKWAEAPPPGAKEVSPRGEGATRGTVYADPVGRWLLATGPEARRGDLVGEGAPLWNGRVLVLEGGPGWLRYATEQGRVQREDGGRWQGPEDGPAWASAVLGVWSGAWPADGAGEALAARLPRGARVILATDDDDAGERYADAIARTLTPRGVDLRRWRPDART